MEQFQVHISNVQLTISALISRFFLIEKSLKKVM